MKQDILAAGMDARTLIPSRAETFSVTARKLIP